MQIFLVIIISLCFGALTSHFSVKRGRNSSIWFIIGFLFGVLGLITLFVLPKNENTLVSVPAAPPIEIKPSIPEGLNKAWFILDKESAQIGPLVFHELQKLWSVGEIHEQSWIWGEGMEKWLKVGEIPDLQIALKK